MPIVNIPITREGTLPGHTRVTHEQKAQLIEGVSKLLLDLLNKPMNSTFVVIHEVDVENWGWGGFPVEEYRKLMAASTLLPDTKLAGIAKERARGLDRFPSRLSFPPAQVRQFLKEPHGTLA